MQPTKSRVDRHTQRKIDKNTTRQTKTQQDGQRQCKSKEKTAWRTKTQLGGQTAIRWTNIARHTISP